MRSFIQSRIQVTKSIWSILFTVVLISVASTGNATGEQQCGFDRIHQKLMETDSRYAQSLMQMEEEIRAAIRRRHPLEISPVIIPVVVHVMHLGEPEGTGANISDAQILDGIRIANEDFRKITGTPGDGGGVDTTIEFALAVRDPDNLPHTGIIRIDMSGNSDYVQYGVKNETEYGVEDSLLKDKIRWDPTRFYNIWVVTEIDDNDGEGGTMGYALLPNASHESDGAVIVHKAFGNTGTASGSPNRTVTHEMGHALGLYHTFEGDNGGDECPTNNDCGAEGDLVCDTPPHKRSSSNCPSGQENPCDPPNLLDEVVHNYMDYSSDTCRNEFTAGQKTRMQAVLAVSGARESLVNSDGLTPVRVPESDFAAAETSIVTGEVQFYDRSQYGASSWHWEFPGGNPSTSGNKNPVVSYTTAGTYPVFLTASNSIGAGNRAFKTSFITVYDPVGMAACTPETLNVGNYGYHISRVSLNTIDNSSGNTVDEGGYIDFSPWNITSLIPGESYELDIDAGVGLNGVVHVNVYIDFDGDGDLSEPGETVLIDETLSSSGTISTPITIPTDVVTDTPLRMRIMADQQAAPSGACSNLLTGQAEDYGLVFHAEGGSGGAPRVVSSFDNTFVVSDIFILEHYAYITSYYQTLGKLQIVDMSNPHSPEFVSSIYTPKMAYGVFVSDSTAYVAGGIGGLQIVDVSNPESPSIMGNLDTSTVFSVFVSETYAYLANGWGGLQIVDVGDPQAPVVTGSFNTQGHARDVYVEGGYVYVADGNNGLEIFDVTFPELPVKKGNVATTDVTDGVYVSEGYAYLADGTNGVRVVDVSHPEEPAVVSTIDTLADARQVFKSGRYLYIACGNNDSIANPGLLLIADLSNPSNPKVIGNVLTGGKATDLYASGDFIYVALEQLGGVQIIDATHKESLIITKATNTPHRAYDIHVTDTHVLVADGNGGLQAIGLNTFPNFMDLSSLSMEGYAYGLDVYNSHAIVLEAGGWLNIVDISNPDALQLISRTSTGSSISVSSDVIVNDHYVYAATGGSLIVVDITSLEAPEIVGSEDNIAARDLCISWPYAYVLGGINYLFVVDISDPHNPDTINLLNLGYEYGVKGIRISGHYAYVAAWDAFVVVDIGDPENPEVVSTIQTPGNPAGLFLSNSCAYIADYMEGVQVVDISDPRRLALLKSVDTEDAGSVVVKGDYVYVADGNAVVQLKDISFSKPNLYCRTESIVFPKTLIGAESEPQTLIIENTGQADLSILSIEIAGLDTLNFSLINNGCGSTLPAESSCSLDIVFNPADYGQKSNGLLVHTNDPDTPYLNVGLTGMGEILHTITSSHSSNGTIFPSGEVLVAHGTDQEFTISANEGYQIENLVVDGVSKGKTSSYMFENVSSDHTIEVSFSIKQYSIHASSGENGTIEPSGLVVVNYGSDQMFVFIPDEGYQIKEVLVDSENQGTPSSYTFTQINQDHDIAVNFYIPLPETITVPSDHPTIQAGIDAAGDGDIVLLEDGVYRGAGNNNLDFKGKSITVQSKNGPANCIIDCENNSRGFYLHSGETEESILSGTTIVNGYGSNGGGILCVQSSPTIINCIIEKCHAYSAGGGIACYTNASPVITNCKIINNSSDSKGGGIEFASNSAAEMEGCLVQSNTNNGYYGGGIDITSASPVITNCIVDGNSTTTSGGGFYIRDDSAPAISKCIIRNNSAEVGAGAAFFFVPSSTISECTFDSNSAVSAGGMIIYDSSTTIQNCVIKNNHSSHEGGGVEFHCYATGSLPKIVNSFVVGNTAGTEGGGIYCRTNNGQFPTIINCTVSENSSLYEGGGIYCSSYNGSAAVIVNSIVWGNSDDDISAAQSEYATSPLISYSNIGLGYEGTGNIDVDPMFVGHGDYHLAGFSPCLDKATDEYAPTFDIDNEARPYMGLSDMGADEYYGEVYAPVAQFEMTSNEGHSPLTTQFIDQSSGHITNWYWDLGDGGTSTSPNPYHLFNLPGSYPVTLSVTGPGGSSSKTKEVLIFPPLGDINGDGKCSLEDAIAVFKLLSNIPISALVNSSADINGDSKIGLEDAIFVLQRIVMQSPFGGEIIGVEGGFIQYAGHPSQLSGIRIDIPPGALDRPVYISVRISETFPDLPESGFERIGYALELSPGGLHFLKPIFITLVNEKICAGDDHDVLVIAIYDRNSNAWDIPTLQEADLENHTITVEATHFSILNIFAFDPDRLSEDIKCSKEFKQLEDTFMIENVESHLSAGNCEAGCWGFSTFTKWYFETKHSICPLRNAYDASSDTPSKIVCETQALQTENYHKIISFPKVLGDKWPMAWLATALMLKKTPQVLGMEKPGTDESDPHKFHALLVYGWNSQDSSFEVYNPNQHLENDRYLSYNRSFREFGDYFGYDHFMYVNVEDKILYAAVENISEKYKTSCPVDVNYAGIYNGMVVIDGWEQEGADISLFGQYGITVEVTNIRPSEVNGVYDVDLVLTGIFSENPFLLKGWLYHGFVLNGTLVHPDGTIVSVPQTCLPLAEGINVDIIGKIEGNSFNIDGYTECFNNGKYHGNGQLMK
ncbi:PKD domain-containing protein [Thermodesulfobacteriota bacterium]